MLEGVSLKKPVTAPRNNLYHLPLLQLSAIPHPLRKSSCYHPSDKLESKEQGLSLAGPPVTANYPEALEQPWVTVSDKSSAADHPAAVASHRAF